MNKEQASSLAGSGPESGPTHSAPGGDEARDAARYRYLRSHYRWAEYGQLSMEDRCQFDQGQYGWLDERIDAAIAKDSVGANSV